MSLTVQLLAMLRRTRYHWYRAAANRVLAAAAAALLAAVAAYTARRAVAPRSVASRLKSYPRSLTERACSELDRTCEK